ncbi:alpha/beta hydrolase [Pectobacterium odoriferum]|uniref:Esterase n=1 Tax=Pectobacterium odoriferum TaxID=78398 RepID=A0ABD6VMM2_9GAMM|nr:alpha/beta hydrolase [Pectobacterium odoriferum]KGA28883.1 esterase [Pectobacterium odoriferum]MCA6960374.1 alpha/beta hydrolase [Pectobacterium odoriferum]MCH5008493.1 alpha/beta hydrolase [Pectobacterium odoriferum]POD93606.1 esterase [Pectobacterium odoriferum]POD98852.1 esterase [Pectobacterium odoriferum]
MHYPKTTKIVLASLTLIGSTAINAAQNQHEIAVKQETTSVKLISDVVYSQVSVQGYPNVALKMDILQPEAKKALPVVLFITGGGFVNANKDNYLQQRLNLAEAGYVVASMEYRVAPIVLFPSPLEDVKSAIRYLRANAKKFGIDGQHTAVFGASAGGYLAAFAGTTNGSKDYDKGDNLDQSSDVQAVIDFYGLSDLTLVGEGFPDDIVQKHTSPSSTEAIWVNGTSVFNEGGAITRYPEKAAAANPINFISRATPPFLIMHGTNDTNVSPRQTERLHQALTEKKIESTYYSVKGAGHGGPHWLQPDIMQITVRFLDKHLKP